MNSARNETMVMNKEMELSVRLVNRNSNEKIKLAAMAITKMVTVPKSTAPPNFLASMIDLSLPILHLMSSSTSIFSTSGKKTGFWANIPLMNDSLESIL